MSFFSRFSIATKLIIVSALLAAIFLGISFAFAVINMRTALANSISSSLEQQVTDETLTVKKLSNETKNTVIALSGTPPIQGIIRARANDGFDAQENSTYEQWTSRLAAIFSAELESKDLYSQIRYLDETGKELVRVNLENGQAVVVPPEELQNKSTRDYFQATMQLPAGEVYIADPSLNKEGEPPTITVPYIPAIRYALPIFDEKTGERRGILIVNAFYDKLVSLATEVSQIPANVYVVDANGYFTTNPKAGNTWGGPNDLQTGVSFKSEFPDLSDNALTAMQGILAYDKSTFIYARLPIDGEHPEKKFLILKEVPSEAIFGSVNQIVFEALAVGVATFAVLFFVFLFAVRKMLAPLRELTKAAEQVTIGKLDVEVAVHSQDELGILSTTFNAMVRSIKEAQSNLEGKVKQRTAELKRTNKLMIGRELKMVELKKEIKKLQEN